QSPAQVSGWKAQFASRVDPRVFAYDMLDESKQRAMYNSMNDAQRKQFTQQYNWATYNEVLAPLGQTYSGPVGQEGVAAVKKTVGDAYNNALGNMTFRATDPQFQADITKLAGMAQGLPAAQQRTFMNTLQTQVFGKLGPQGMMDGPTLQGAQSELGRISRGYSGDASFD
ncbi:hypothetical protein SB396_32200, partial [Burkholderia cenocepacia]|uniref:hypothetical protein n=1 Tax=Burkholderia cenocepacia TaxID=95486 RepID=UPI002B24E0E9